MILSANESRMVTWNPVTGCAKISGGCRFCFAERISHRYGTTTLPWSRAHVSTNVVLHLDRLEAPLRWRKARAVFAGSMTDLFGEFVPDDYVAAILAVIALTGSSTFMIITKRAERMADLLCSDHFWGQFAAAALARGADPAWLADLESSRIIPNLTLCVTIESDRFVGRADSLRRVPAGRKMVVAEPLLTALPSLVMVGFDEISVGGESGGPAQRRLVEPCPHPDHELMAEAVDSLCAGTGWVPKEAALAWVRDLRDRSLAAGIAFSLHQWGGPTGRAGGTRLDGQTY